MARNEELFAARQELSAARYFYADTLIDAEGALKTLTTAAQMIGFLEAKVEFLSIINQQLNRRSDGPGE